MAKKKKNGKLPACGCEEAMKHERCVIQVKEDVKPRGKNQTKKQAATAICNKSLNCFVNATSKKRLQKQGCKL